MLTAQYNKLVSVPVPNQEIVQRLRWYVNLRWFFLLAITLPSLTSLYIGTGLAAIRSSSLAISIALLSTNGVFYGLSRIKRGNRYYHILGMCMLAFDVLFISYFIYDKGGIESRSELLYTLPILMAAALYARRGVYITAICAAISFDFVIIGNYFGLLHSPQALTNQALNGTYVINSAIFFTAALLMVATLADFLTRLLIKKEREASGAAAALQRAQAIAKIGSWEWDVACDEITWSEELSNIFGIARHVQKSSYQTYLKRVHPDDRQWLANMFDRSLKNHQPFSFDHRIVRPDKTFRIVHGEGKALVDKQHTVVQLYGTAQDITAERALEVAKGDFVSLASHQLRTPASGVRMLLAMLRDGYSGPLRKDQRAMVEQAYEANERMLHIADDLLNVAKLESGRLALNKHEIELGSWLKTMLVQQKMLAKEQHQKLKLDIPKVPIYILADAGRLAMVIDNLLSNARKYTAPQGTIKLSLVPEKQMCAITVTDTGHGMTKTEVGRLFGKFTRLDNLASKGTDGTGLGLYLAKSIVDLHQGNIRVKSKVGTGTSFTVRLPWAAV